VQIVCLLPEFEALVRSARSNVDFKRRFRAWLDGQTDGPLGPLLSDMVRLWSGTGTGHTLAEARAVLRRIGGRDPTERARGAIARFASVAGVTPDCDVVLFAGLRRPEGYSRFDEGRNTIFIGLDHASNQQYADHLELILAHELTHAVRDPTLEVLADYDGWPAMTHDDFVERHPFREHLVSEALATAVSEIGYPGKPEWRYIYFAPDDHAWCDGHRREIADRMRRALADAEDYDTFYARGSVTPDSPDCCDYYFGLHFGRHVLAREPAAPILRTPCTEILARFLEPFVHEFVGPAPGDRGRAERAAARVDERAARDATEDELLAEGVRRFQSDLAGLLSARPGAARDAQHALEAAVAGERLEYAGEPHDVGIGPLALSAEDEAYLRWVTERLLGTAEKVVELYRRDPEVRAYFGFPPHLEQHALGEPGYRPLVPIGRFDSFWNGKRVRFLELNTNGTAAIVLADRIGPLFLGLDATRPIVARHRLQALPLVRPLVDTLLDCWRQAAEARGLAERPAHVAIVDWDGLPTRHELVQLGQALGADGLDVTVVDPKQLTYDGVRLSARGQAIDLVYRRLTTVDIVRHPDALRPLLDAARDGRVVVVGSGPADVAHSKRLFAVLTHERWRRHFTMEERALIDAHVPWTRIFRPGLTLHGGRLRDLRELALAERERFVLKPAEGAEGRDVVLGVELAAAEWEREISRRYGGYDVIQECVEAPERTFVVPDGDGLSAVSQHLHLGEYVFGGTLAGFLARVSTELVLSVSSDDRVVPCLVLAGETEDDRSSDLSHP
jgi:hypothetical protein